MTKENEKLESLTDATSFIKELREFAVTVGEECPEGHRRDPGSGRCLPIGGIDHTAFTRSLNDDQGPEWRGEVVREENDQMLASVDENTETAADAHEMDEPESCAEGTTFSFVQRRCVTLEEAEAEDDGERAFFDEENEEDAAAPGQGGHQEIVNMQPEGRRDTVNHNCPPDMMFDFVLRECIPLNKDTRMASEVTPEFASLATIQEEVAFGLPEKEQFPLDTKEKAEQVINTYEEIKGELTPAEQTTLLHNLTIAAAKFNITDAFVNLPTVTASTDWISQVFKREWQRVVASVEEENKEEAKELKTKTRNALPSSSFGVPGKRKFPLHDCSHVRNAMARFNQAKGLTSSEKATLRRKILARASACGIDVKKFGKANTEAEFSEVVVDLLTEHSKQLAKEIQDRYSVSEDMKKRGPCPPGMEWDAKMKKCAKMKGFVDQVTANHSDIVKMQPEGRRDTVGHQCPPGQFFDYTRRRCLPLDPSQKEGTTTEKAFHFEEEARTRIAEALYHLVADAFVMAVKGYNFHWNVVSPLFDDLHEIFGEDYEKLLEEADCLAERIRALGYSTPGSLNTFLGTTSMSDQAELPDWRGMVSEWLADHEHMSSEARVAQQIAEDYGDNNTLAMLDSIILCHDKRAWMLRSMIQESPDSFPTVPGRGLRRGSADKAANKDLSPLPKGKPARLPQDCPKGTIWDGDLRKCKPLDSSKKTKSAEEEAQGPANGPGNKGGPGCPDGQFMNPVTKKCMPRKGAFKGKSEQEDAQAQPGNREGLTPPPAGKVQHQSDCPPNTAWDAKMKICRPIDSMDKDRPSGASPQSPKSTAVDSMSPARLIHELDRILSLQEGGKEKSRVAAKDLPNAAFPPSTVSSTKRILMHHTPDVEDPYDNASIDVGRLRNALARASKVEGFSAKAIDDATEHLLYHAREIVKAANSKKA